LSHNQPIYPQKYHCFNKILINEQALTDSHKFLKQFQAQAQIAPILKSNAYDRGLTTIAPVF